MKALILLVEAIEKQFILRLAYKAYPPEATSGVYSRSFFWWLNPLFAKGFTGLIQMEDLFTLDKHLFSERVHERMEAAWNRGRASIVQRLNK